MKLASFTSKARHALAPGPLASPHPHPHHARTPTASPSGVLRHRDDPFAVPLPRSLRPRALTGVLTLTTRVQAVPLVRGVPLRGQCCRCVAPPLEPSCAIGRPNCTHARDSAACQTSCLGRCGVDQFVPLPDGRAWEGGGRRARSRSPRFGQVGASSIGVFPRLSHACSRPWGEGPDAAPPASTNSVRGLPPLAQGDGRVHTVPS